MPRFDFECLHCAHTFESTIPFGVKTLPLCPLCKSTTQKCITPPSIHFKGKGFYKTDSTLPAKTAPKEPPTQTKTEKKETKPEKQEKSAGDAKK